MGSELAVFDFNGMGVRVIKDSGGEPWFVAKDIAEILGYTDTQAMTRRLDEDEISSCTDKSSGQGRRITIINESGLYNAILGSNKPEAKSFKRWVTREVLPEIRKTGAYVAAGETESDEEIMARALLAAQRTIERNKARIGASKMNEEITPKVLVCVKDKIVREVSEAGSAESTAVVVAPSGELVKGGQGRSDKATAESVWMVAACVVMAWVVLLIVVVDRWLMC